MASTLANALDFFREFGVFDVILPFLLIFAVVFAILQKTKLLGDNKANLDAIVAFVIGLLVVAATKVVAVINNTLPQIMLLVVVGLSFLLMIGIFADPKRSFFDDLSGGFKIGLMIFMTVAVILIFLANIKTSGEESWLEYAWNYLMDYWSGAVVGSIVMFIVVIAAIWLIVGGGKTREERKKE